ncbi:MAG: PDZ domain-containing protein, partial [Bacteriovoracaceae bacterium]|nr:PDZ domain-containing protein [Bacteriovoracaceae bacterium]
MSKINWQQVYKRYLPLLDKVHTRFELSDLMWEMQGELGTSHAYEGMGDYHREMYPSRNGYLGGKFKWIEKEKAFEVQEIHSGDSWIPGADSPLNAPSVGLKKKDLIYGVDGQKFKNANSLDEALIGKAGAKVNLAIARKKTKKGYEDQEFVVVSTLVDEHMMLYRQWVDKNKEYVHKKSGGKLGYIHVPNMGPWGFSEFYRNFLTEVNHEGLVIDIRYNGGGHVSQHLLKILAQKKVGFDTTRYFGVEPYPMYAPGALVCLTNEHAGSDGDIFPHSFKLMKLGKLVGKRTWGGVIGIWPRVGLNDGAYTTQPEFSFWFKDVGFGVENFGTKPDIEIDNTPKDFADGKDAQLDKAIQVGLQDVRKNPDLKPNFKDYPDLKLPKLPKN